MEMPAAGEEITVRAARPPVAASFRGDIAEVWRGDTQLGLLYQWSVHGSNGEWSGEAAKYRLHSVGGGEVEIRLFLTALRLTLIGKGHILGDPVPDGELHKTAIAIKGTGLEVA